MSLNAGENSPKKRENAKMSSRSDVLEMQGLCGQIADRLAQSHRDKDRARAVSHRLGLTWNRSLEFLKAKARKVESWEKDYAREAVAELKRADRARKDAEHFAWLEDRVGRLKASGEELRGPHIDAFERVLRLGREDTGPLDREG